jgi:hypothetical protein
MIIQVIRWSIDMRQGLCSMFGGVLFGIPEEKRACGRPRHVREDNIDVDLEGIGWKCDGLV